MSAAREGTTTIDGEHREPEDDLGPAPARAAMQMRLEATIVVDAG